MHGICWVYLCVCAQYKLDNMAACFLLLTVACLVVNAAPPAPQHGYRQQQTAQLQQISPIEYLLDNEEANYYGQAQQKQENANRAHGSPARLETLEPDSEVELINGGQQPQQPQPQVPTLPGLAPGQRVFIVQMPVPGYRPGTISGYQPVYIVAAGAQGNGAGFPGNGYQNAILLDQGQLVSPFVGYPRSGVQDIQRGPQDVNPGFVLGAPLLNRPFELAYQQPSIPYQPGPVYQGVNYNQVPVAQLINAQPQPLRPAAARPGNVQSAAQSQSLMQANRNVDSNESEEARRNARPSPPHAVANEKA